MSLNKQERENITYTKVTDISGGIPLATLTPGIKVRDHFKVKFFLGTHSFTPEIKQCKALDMLFNVIFKETKKTIFCRRANILLMTNKSHHIDSL